MKSQLGGKDPGKLIGKWCRVYTEGVVVDAHFAAMRSAPADYVQWMTGRMQSMRGQRPTGGGGAQRPYRNDVFKAARDAEAIMEGRATWEELFGHPEGM
jgi:hypothetical protein